MYASHRALSVRYLKKNRALSVILRTSKRASIKKH